MNCPLCKEKGSEFFKDDFFLCNNCQAIFRNKEKYLDVQAEKQRYEEHNNDVNDISYQKFVLPIVSYVLNNFTVKDQGLDFGCGTGPVISKLLHDKKYKIEQFDIFFANDQKLLEKKYDYIVICEVIEHFSDPQKEFENLKKMLKKDGALICMTDLYSKDIDFAKWYYKNDPSHVFFYHAKTIELLAKKLKFKSFDINNRLIILKN